MATITKTFTENASPSNKSTWTFQITGSDITVASSTFTFNMPTIEAKYVGSDKGYSLCRAHIERVMIGEYWARGDYTNAVLYARPAYWTSMTTGTSGTFYTLVEDTYMPGQPHSLTLSTSNVFNASNKTMRTLPVATRYSVRISGASSKDSGGTVNYNSGYAEWNDDRWVLGSVTLNAPPTFTAYISYDGELYKMSSRFTVDVTNATALYGGEIRSVSLTIGSQTITRSSGSLMNTQFNVVPQEAGLLTPIVSVTDSRGQVATKALPPIRVYENYMPVTLLSSRALTTTENETYGVSNGVRVDMLVHCESGGRIIEDTSPQLDLYDVNNTQLVLPYTSTASIMECYAIIDTSNQVPNSNLNIAILSPAMQYNYTPIGNPSTATPTQIKQEGETNLISPTIDVTNIRFNPETTGINKYTVGDVVGVTTTNMTKSQTNVDNDVKHIVTHASNVRINNTTTLQDWITEQYNNLT